MRTNSQQELNRGKHLVQTLQNSNLSFSYFSLVSRPKPTLTQYIAHRSIYCSSLGAQWCVAGPIQTSGPAFPLANPMLSLMLQA